MAKSHLKVTQDWRQHFDAPVSLVRCAAESGDILAADEEGAVYMLDRSGRSHWSKTLDVLTAAIAIESNGQKAAVVCESGEFFIFDRQGRCESLGRRVFQPVSLDLAPGGERAAVADAGGKICFIDCHTGQRTPVDVRGTYRYVRCTPEARALLAVGLYGEVMFLDDATETIWQKDFRCNTRLPCLSSTGSTILIPSPYFGIIVLGRDGKDRGVFDVPGGPKCVTVSGDGERIFVINEDNELIIFEAGGKVLFRQPMGVSVHQMESDAAGASFAAAMTSGSLERYRVSELAGRRDAYLEFSISQGTDSTEGPAVLWRSKVFSALGGPRGGQLAVTPSAKHVALLDVEGNFRIFDRTGSEAALREKIYGFQPTLKAAKSHDFVAAASSKSLLAVDLSSYRQRRFSIKNEWTTHFDISPAAIFLAVADFFRGVSLYDENLDRQEFLETEYDVLGIAVDGSRHTLAALSGGSLVFFSEHGSEISRIPYPSSTATAMCGLHSGFAVAGGGRVDTFTSEGRQAWSVDAPGEITSIQPTRSGLVLAAADSSTAITNAHGTVIARLRRRANARYFSTGKDHKEIISIESRGRLLTARSTDKGVLWRREMDDDIIAMEISPEGSCVALLAGIYLYVLATAAGGRTPQEKLFLEI